MVGNESFTVCDNISDNYVIDTVRASAPDGQPLTYRLIDNAGGLFEIGENNGELSLASGKSLDYTMATQHTITVVVSNTVAIKDTSTVSFQIDVNTAPLLISNVAFTWGSNVSMYKVSRDMGEMITGFTPLNDLPEGLEFVSSNGQLFIQGTPSKVTVNSNGITSVPVEVKVQNKCGSNSTRTMVTVNPIFVSGDLSPGIFYASGSLHPSNSIGDHYKSNVHSATNFRFASGGTGAYNDPLLIGVADGATTLSYVFDMSSINMLNILGLNRAAFDAMNTEQKLFTVRLLNMPVGGRVLGLSFEYITAEETNGALVNVYGFHGLPRSIGFRGDESHLGAVHLTIYDSNIIPEPYFIYKDAGTSFGYSSSSSNSDVKIRLTLSGITRP